MAVRYIGKTPQQLLKEVESFKKEALTIAGTESVNHFKQSFIDGGFTDNGFEAWQGRKNDVDPGRAILVGKGGGHLKRAIRIQGRSEGKSITVGVDADEIPYAEIHNEGGTITIPITPAMRAHFWKMWYGLGGLTKAAGKKVGERSSYNAGMSSAANFYKAMALTKKQALTVTIPKRKFVGTSKVLNAKITKRLEAELKRRLG